MFEGPQPLVACIHANPDDDAPRLVLADWLEDHGDGHRAAFVRAQVEAAHYEPYADETLVVRRRAAWLRSRHAARWCASLPALPGIKFDRFERGFVARAVAGSFADLRREAAVLARTCATTFDVPWPAAPEELHFEPPRTLHTLVLRGTPAAREACVWLAGAPWLQQIRWLKVLDHEGPFDDVRTLLSSPWLRGLHGLDLARRVSPDLLEVLEGLPALAELRVENCPPGWEVDERTRDLHTIYNEDLFDELEPTVLEGLARWEGLGRLRVLDLASSVARPASLAALLQSPGLHALKALALPSLWGWGSFSLPKGSACAPTMCHFGSQGDDGLLELVRTSEWLRRAEWVDFSEVWSTIRGFDLGHWLDEASYAGSVRAARFPWVIGWPSREAVPRLTTLRASGFDAEHRALGVRHLQISAYSATELASIELPALEWLDFSYHSSQDDDDWGRFQSTDLGRRLGALEGGAQLGVGEWHWEPFR